MSDPEEKAEKASRIVGKPYSPEQAAADMELLPIIGDTVKEVEFVAGYCYINLIFTSGRVLRVYAAGCYDFVVEVEARHE